MANYLQKINWLRVTGKVSDIAYWVLFVLSPSLGFLLASMADLKIYKLLNFIGVIWSAFGVITLSNLASASEEFKISALKVVSRVFGTLLYCLPIGIATGGVFAIIFGYPSAKATASAGLYLIAPGAISAIFLTTLVRGGASTNRRVALLGGYFVFVGLVAQGVGALFDLIDFNG